MEGLRFSKITDDAPQGANFESLLKIFLELLVYTNGDVGETLSWMNQLDQEYKLTDENYGMGDFIEDLKRQGYIRDGDGDGTPVLTPKSERSIRKNALEEIFGKLKKKSSGGHRTTHTGIGDETTADHRPYQFGDPADHILMTESIQNAQINHGIGEFMMTDDDLQVAESEYKTVTSTVLMIDISHSMILYGEDRITPAKNVAMALAELITTRYPKDKLDIIVFGNDAWPIQIKDLPYLEVGPYHTNTIAGLELAMDLLRRRKTHNKQIFMITDGKPTCMKEAGTYYKNSFGLDRRIVNKTLQLAAHCRKLNIPITTFMIARDPYLQRFVRDFTQTNNGRAFYSTLDGLGEYIFEDYIKNRRRTVR